MSQRFQFRTDTDAAREHLSEWIFSLLSEGSRYLWWGRDSVQQAELAWKTFLHDLNQGIFSSYDDFDEEIPFAPDLDAVREEFQAVVEDMCWEPDLELNEEVRRFNATYLDLLLASEMAAKTGTTHWLCASPDDSSSVVCGPMQPDIPRSIEVRADGSLRQSRRGSPLLPGVRGNAR
jgi:hypothetical protein